MSAPGDATVNLAPPGTDPSLNSRRRGPRRQSGEAALPPLPRDTCADTPSASVNFASVIKTNGIYGVGGGGEAGGHGFRSLIAGAVGVFGVGGVQKIAAPNFTARLLFFVTICVARRRGIKNLRFFGISPGSQLYYHAAPLSKT